MMAGVADGGDGQAQLQAADRSADRGVAALAELIAPARSRDSGNTILAKEFRGGVLVMTGANSAVGLRSMPVRYLFLDEVDGYRWTSRAKAMRSRWPRRARAPLPGARSSSFRRRRSRGVGHRARVRGQRPTSLLRAVPALLPPAVAALRAAALGQGRAGNRGLHLRVLRHRDCRAPQDVDAGARRMAR
jgi:hypothetical protein